MGTILVMPVKSRVSAFCTQEMVDEGVTPKEAFEFLVKGLHSKKISWASYGEYDKNMLRKQGGMFELDCPFGSVYTNVKTLFKKRYSEYKGNLGMEAAYKAVMPKPVVLASCASRRIRNRLCDKGLNTQTPSVIRFSSTPSTTTWIDLWASGGSSMRGCGSVQMTRGFRELAAKSSAG